MRTVFTTRDGKRLEEALWQRLQREEPGLAATAQAYADGINAWLADLRAGRNGATLPPEYTLDTSSAPAISPRGGRRTRSPSAGCRPGTLSQTLDEELFFAERQAALPDALRRDVFRSAPAAPATVLPAAEPARRRARAPRRASAPPQRSRRAACDGIRTDARRRTRGSIRSAPPTPSRGSNNWIVAPGALRQRLRHAGQRSASAAVQSADLAHGAARRGRAGGRPASTSPACPASSSATTTTARGAATVSVFDVTDVYVEQVTTPPDYPSSPRTVLFNGAQVPVLRVVEEFALPGGTVSAVIEVVPHHGPMVPDPDPNDGVVGLAATNMSFRWTGHEISLDSRFLTQLNQARNVEEFKAAVRNFAVGGQNWVWADVNGDIAYFPYVLVPQRPAGTIPYLPLDGTGGAEWLRDDGGDTLWLPEEQFPQAVNPPRGFLATANNDQIGNTLDNDPLNDEIYLTFTADLGFRAAAHPGPAVERRRRARPRAPRSRPPTCPPTSTTPSASRRRGCCRSCSRRPRHTPTS